MSPISWGLGQLGSLQRRADTMGRGGFWTFEMRMTDWLSGMTTLLLAQRKQSESRAGGGAKVLSNETDKSPVRMRMLMRIQIRIRRST
jgi:hypothetical protein